MAARGRGRFAAAGVMALVVLVVSALTLVGYLRSRGIAPPAIVAERCVATANAASVILDPDQAHFASIIAGLSVRRALPPRAASIALTTAYQESDLRNLDHGDRDSVGLFQQRPSQGWGTEKQLQDPYYATNKFYDALVRIKGWQTGDLTKVAQRVQRSGYPEAYRDHETDARVLASVFTGHSPAGVSCLDRSETSGRVAALAKSLRATFGKVAVNVSGDVVTVEAGERKRAWAYGHHAVANAHRFGVASVRVRDRGWSAGGLDLPTWEKVKAGDAAVEITVR